MSGRRPLRSVGSPKDVRRPLGRLVLPRGAAFGVVAVATFLAFASNAAASPLYKVYQTQFGFSAITLTALFTVYAIVLLGTLLFLGSLSDYVGRRPVLLAGLAMGSVACLLFVLSDGIGLLFAGRALQGVAVGLITGAAAAALHDLRPQSSVAPVLSSVAPTAGQALGAVAASVLGQYAVAPTRLIWWLLLAMFIATLLAMLTVQEPGSRRVHVQLGVLRPQVSVPRAARGAFAAALPCLVGLWALGGFYLSLGPSLAAELLHSSNLVWGGILIFLLTGLGAVASGALAKASPTRIMLIGCFALTVGALVTFTAIGTETPGLLFLGTAIAGFGFGPGFLGAYRATVTVPLVTSTERAGLITAVYIVSYSATAVPAVVGGIATTLYGLHDTALVYCATVGLLTASAALILMARRTSTSFVQGPVSAGAEPAPGACTVPACPPNSSQGMRV